MREIKKNGKTVRIIFNKEESEKMLYPNKEVLKLRDAFLKEVSESSFFIPVGDGSGALKMVEEI